MYVNEDRLILSSSYDENETAGRVIGGCDDEDDPIILPIPYEDEAAEEARLRAAAAKKRAEQLAELRDNAPEIVPLPFTDEENEITRKKEAAELARRAAEEAAALALEAQQKAEAALLAAQKAALKKSAAEAASIASKQAEISFDENGNSIVKIVVPKNFDMVITFKPKES